MTPARSVSLPQPWFRWCLFTILVGMTVATLAGSMARTIDSTAGGASYAPEISGFGDALQAVAVGIWLSLLLIFYPFPRLTSWLGMVAALVFAGLSWFAGTDGFSNWRGGMWLITAGLLLAAILVTHPHGDSPYRSKKSRPSRGLALLGFAAGLLVMAVGIGWTSHLATSATEFRAQAQIVTGEVTELEYAGIHPTVVVRVNGTTIHVPYVMYPMRVGAVVEVRLDPETHRSELVADPTNTNGPLQAVGLGLVLCASGVASLFQRRRITRSHLPLPEPAQSE